MMRVYKYELTGERTTIQLPLGYTVLKAAFQGRFIMIWALVSDAPTVPVDFIVVFTGEPVPDGNFAFVDTLFNGPLVFHVFRSKERSEP